MKKDKHKARESILHAIDTPEQKERDQAARRSTLLIAANHAFSAIDFVNLVEALGLEDELEERLLGRPELQTAVTKARLAAQAGPVLTTEEI